MTSYVLGFEEVGKEDVQRCGGKGANLGELTRAGIRVPPGFCIMASALTYVMEVNSLGGPIAEIAARLDFGDPSAVEAGTASIRSLICSASIPADLESSILDRYRALVADESPYVAVRSSVAVRDSTLSSFPGMMDTYHYVLGERELLEKVRECWASLWTTRAAFARHSQGIAHDHALIAPVVQAMVDADTAGVLFTANPITGAANQIVIESNWGIGESVVSGKSMNDFYVLDKASLAVEERRIARKNLMVSIDRGRGSGRAELEVPPERASEATLTEAQLVELGETATRIERHFKFNVDVEWAYQDGTLYILQARRIRRLAKSNGNPDEKKGG